MKFRALLTCALAGVLFAGCKTVPLRTNPLDHRTAAAPGQKVFKIDWHVKLVGSQLFDLVFFPRELASPAVDPESGRIFVATRDGFVRAVNPGGQIEWTFKTGGPFQAGPTVHEDVVYVPGGDGVLYALRATNGELLWKYDAGEQLATPPVITEGRVFVASQGNVLYAVEAQTGKWLWQYRRDLPTGFMVHGASAPAVSMGTLFVGFNDGAVVALEPDSGIVKWERVISNEGREFLDVDTTPVIDDQGRVFVASYKNGIYALNGETGDVLWNTATAGVTGAIGRGDVVFASGDRGLTAVLADDGKVLWTLSLDKKSAQPPAFVRGMIVTPVNNSLMFVDPSTGRTRLEWDPGQGVSSTPVYADGHLYVLSNNGYLYALRLERRGI